MAAKMMVIDSYGEHCNFRRPLKVLIISLKNVSVKKFTGFYPSIDYLKMGDKTNKRV